MATLENLWRRVAKDLSLQVTIPFVLTLSSGSHVCARVLVKNFGAPNGMLIFSNFDLISEHTDQIIQSGFGYSVIDDPLENKTYSLKTIQEMLIDWGWSGSREAEPAWINHS